MVLIDLLTKSLSTSSVTLLSETKLGASGGSVSSVGSASENSGLGGVGLGLREISSSTSSWIWLRTSRGIGVDCLSGLTLGGGGRRWRSCLFPLVMFFCTLLENTSLS